MENNVHIRYIPSLSDEKTAVDTKVRQKIA